MTIRVRDSMSAPPHGQRAATAPGSCGASSALSLAKSLVLAWALVLAGGAAAQPSSAGSDAVYRWLTQGGHLDGYLQAMVADVAADLARSARRWPSAQVNQAPRAGALNLFVVDSQALPETDERAPLRRGDVEGGALTDEQLGLIYLDSALLKELASVAVQRTQQGVDTWKALATVRTRGLPAMRASWDARLFEAPDSGGNNQAVLLLRGAIGFIVAHEMGHLAQPRPAGAPPAIQAPTRLTGRQRDERNACPELIDPDHAAQQQLESAADAYAAQLINSRCDVSRDGQLRHLTYVLGADWYFLCAMSSKMLSAGQVTQSPNIHRMLSQFVGPELYASLIAQAGERQNRGFVHVAFPDRHPPDYQRALAFDQLVARANCGGGSRSGNDMSMLLEQLRQGQCRALAAAGGRR
jgi:hypothetical protein